MPCSKLFLSFVSLFVLASLPLIGLAAGGAGFLGGSCVLTVTFICSFFIAGAIFLVTHPNGIKKRSSHNRERIILGLIDSICYPVLID